jgi:hypothetical protein
MGQKVDYAAVLADLEAKRADMDRMIVWVKSQLAPTGTGSIPGPGGTPAQATSADLPKEVAPGVFHGKSVSEAAKMYLEMKKVKQKTRVLCDALLQGGIESDSKNFYSNVYTTLSRNKDFFLRGKYWMLTSWDPRRAAAAAAKPSKKSRRGKKTTRAQASSPVGDKRKVVDISSSNDKAQTA